MGMLRFPEGFLWGTATSAYQIEGAVDEDGRGPSIWDTFSHTPGKTFAGHTGDVACDHYHRWPEDLQLLRELGAPVYRFSIAWPRILPNGDGPVNERGLAFYERLIDALLDAGLTPFVTLYHWDLPQSLQDRGGWAQRETAEAFARYAAILARRLGDRVRYWITLNEPWVVAYLGHYEGSHAPGIRDLATAIRVAHHQLLGHGLAVQAIRAEQSHTHIGITLNFSPCLPASSAEVDHEAASRFDGILNRWFLDPLFGRGYPLDILERFLPVYEPPKGDLAVIAQPLDFLGVNYYSPAFVRATATADNPLGLALLSPSELAERGYELTDMGWAVVPTGLEQLLLRLTRDHAPRALYVTENGAAYPDEFTGELVNDQHRIAYLSHHIAAAHCAIQQGVPLRGYFVWSLLDNFEWAHGYSKRFGLVFTDYRTLARIPKASFHWYRGVVTANGVEDAD